MYATMGVEAEDLQIALGVIEARYGSVDAYLEQALGMDAAQEQIEARLVE